MDADMDMDADVYHYDPETNELAGTSIADCSPLEPGVRLLPLFATYLVAPVTGEREVAVFDDDLQEWHVKPDWRGVELCKKSDGSAVSISQIGITPSDIGATDKPVPNELCVWLDDGWVLDETKVADQLSKLKTQAVETITDLVAGVRMAVAGTSDVLEVAGWPEKLRVAKAIATQTATDADLASLQNEVDKRAIPGETLDDFVAKVMRNAAVFSAVTNELDGIKRNARDAIAAALNAQDLKECVDAFVLSISTKFKR